MIHLQIVRIYPIFSIMSMGYHTSRVHGCIKHLENCIKEKKRGQNIFSVFPNTVILVSLDSINTGDLLQGILNGKRVAFIYFLKACKPVLHY